MTVMSTRIQTRSEVRQGKLGQLRSGFQRKWIARATGGRFARKMEDFCMCFKGLRVCCHGL